MLRAQACGAGRCAGSLAGKVRGTAEFFYDEHRVLVAARLTVKASESKQLLERLARGSKTTRSADGAYVLKALHLRLEAPTDGLQVIRISTEAFDASFPRESDGFGLPAGRIILAAGVAFLVLSGLWCGRRAL